MRQLQKPSGGQEYKYFKYYIKYGRMYLKQQFFVIHQSYIYTLNIFKYIARITT